MKSFAWLFRTVQIHDKDRTFCSAISGLYNPMPTCSLSISWSLLLVLYHWALCLLEVSPLEWFNDECFSVFIVVLFCFVHHTYGHVYVETKRVRNMLTVDNHSSSDTALVRKSSSTLCSSDRTLRHLPSYSSSTCLSTIAVTILLLVLHPIVLQTNVHRSIGWVQLYLVQTGRPPVPGHCVRYLVSCVRNLAWYRPVFSPLGWIAS